MVSYLYGRILSSMWLKTANTPADTPTSNLDRHSSQGVLLRQSRGTYVSRPVGLDPQLLAAVQKLNVEVAFTMSTEITDLIFSLLGPEQTELVLGIGGSQYQILESLEEIAQSTSSKVKRFQYACFVRREKVLLLWHDDVERILLHAIEVERRLLTVVSKPLSPRVTIIGVRVEPIHFKHSRTEVNLKLSAEAGVGPIFSLSKRVRKR